ncbi:MAG: hypothetical protein LBF05_05275 [Tannerella sp.]|jgi:hypothetical protein|nr:hypothetical protein [Tannerella sp.]
MKYASNFILSFDFHRRHNMPPPCHCESRPHFMEEKGEMTTSSWRGAQRRGNPGVYRVLDCFTAFTMTNSERAAAMTRYVPGLLPASFLAVCNDDILRCAESDSRCPDRHETSGGSYKTSGGSYETSGARYKILRTDFIKLCKVQYNRFIHTRKIFPVESVPTVEFLSIGPAEASFSCRLVLRT